MSCVINIDDYDIEVLMTLDATHLFKDENLQYKSLRQIKRYNLKLYQNTLEEGMLQYTLKSKHYAFTREQHIDTLELMLETLNTITKFIDSDEKQMPRIEPVILSNLMAIGMNYGVIEDNGVGERFCFNPKEKCRNYKRNDIAHCGRFHHFDKNLCDILKDVVSYTLDNLVV